MRTWNRHRRPHTPRNPATSHLRSAPPRERRPAPSPGTPPQDSRTHTLAQAPRRLMASTAGPAFWGRRCIQSTGCSPAISDRRAEAACRFLARGVHTPRILHGWPPLPRTGAVLRRIHPPSSNPLRPRDFSGQGSENVFARHGEYTGGGKSRPHRAFGPIMCITACSPHPSGRGRGVPRRAPRRAPPAPRAPGRRSNRARTDAGRSRATGKPKAWHWHPIPCSRTAIPPAYGPSAHDRCKRSFRLRANGSDPLGPRNVNTPAAARLVLTFSPGRRRKNRMPQAFMASQGV